MMKAYEYIAEVLSDGHLSIPDNIKQQIKPSEKVRVMVLLEDEDASWTKLAMSEFFQGYSDKDAIYDNL
jgi:hypothetical protein